MLSYPDMPPLTESELREIHDASLEVIQQLAPRERYSFEGIWSDTVNELSANFDQLEAPGFAIPTEGHLILSTIVIPAGLWLGKKLADGVVGAPVDLLKDWIKSKLGSKSKPALNDADVQRIADALSKSIERRRRTRKK